MQKSNIKTKEQKRLIMAFGSRVTGKTNTNSDYDFAVLEDKPLTLEKKFRLIDYIAKKMKINGDKIDLVDMNTASPLLMHEVAEKGKLVEGSDFDFIRFKIRAWKTYLDTAKFRRLREQSIKEYVKRIHLQKA